MFKRLFAPLLSLAAAFAFQSKLRPSASDAAVLAAQYNPFPNGRLKFFGYNSTAIDRKRRSNRLHTSKKTRNKHR